MRRMAKKSLRACKYNGVVPTMNPEKFGKLLLWMIGDEHRRTVLVNTLNKEKINPLHIQIFRAFWVEDDAMQKALPLEDFCLQGKDKEWFMVVERFKTWLAEERYAPEQAHSIAVISCAFAMLQPEEATNILTALLEHDAAYSRWLLPDVSEPTDMEESDVQDAEPVQPEEAPSECEPPEEELEVVLPPPSTGGDPLDLAELIRGKGLLGSFLETHRQMHDVVKRLPSKLDNLSTSNAAAEQDVLAEISDALTQARRAEAAAQTWLAELSAAMQQNGVAEAAAIEPALETMGAHVAQSRETHDLLRNACEEIGKLLRELGANAVARSERLASALSEIRAVDTLVGRAHYQPSRPMPTANLLHQIQLLIELEAQAQRAKAERDSFLLERKRELQEQLEKFAGRYDLAVIGPDLVTRIEYLRSEIHACETPKALAEAQQAVNEFESSLRQHPETRNIDDLASEALLGKPATLTVLPIVQSLNARGRASEALALLNCLQATTAVETAGPDDFSALVDELMRASALLAASSSFVWIDGVFQQTWVSMLSRQDVKSYSTWQRLAVAFVVQQHLRGTDQELDLFFSLGFQNDWPRDRFPMLGRCLQGIATRHPTKVLTEKPASQRRTAEERISRFFRKNNRGGYIEQAAQGDDFYRMEKFHLFPRLENIVSEVLKLCDQGNWSAARHKAEQKTDRLLVDACRVAGIDSGESVYYRRKVLDPHDGYLPKISAELAALIDTAEQEHGSDINYVIADDLLVEIARIAKNEPHFDVFWEAIKVSLTQPPAAAAGVNSGDELFWLLAQHFGPVITLAAEYVVARCETGPACKPSEETLSQMLKQLAVPSADLGILLLQSKQCFRHALRVIDQTEMPPFEFTALRTEIANQLERLEATLATRWESLANNPIAELRLVEYETTVHEGCFGFLQKLLGEADTRIARAANDTRDQVRIWLDAQSDRLNAIKRAAAVSEVSEEWVGKVLSHCASIDKLLLMGGRYSSQHKPLAFRQELLESALTALKFIVDSAAHSFTEVDGYLAELTHLNLPEKVVSVNTVLITEIATPWEVLKSLSRPSPQMVAHRWQELARNFCAACRLYHDLHQTLKFAAVKDYRWGRYTTAFHDPRSSWLDREVRIYLCFAEKTPTSELEPLIAELESNRECLNLVFVPQGLERLGRLWKYDPFHSPYLLIGDELLAKISAAQDAEGQPRHDVPLRQALHQTAEHLTAVGLFKSEGYVHLRKNIFVGRRDALQQLRQQPASVIWGGRRTGKTSLLQALGESLRSSRLSEGPYAVALVYGDKATDDPDLAIARSITQGLALPEPNTLIDFERLIRGACAGQRVAVLIDEMDSYIELSRKLHGPSAFPLARTLRGLSQWDSARFKVVYAGFKQLYYEVRMRPGADPSDPFKNIVKPVVKDFRDLDLKEVEELMTIGFIEMLGIEMEPSVPRLVTRKTSGHPAFVQRFCERLLARVSKRRQFESRLTLTGEDVEDTYLEHTPPGSEDTAFIDYVNETLGWNVSHLERAILLALSTDIRSSNISDEKDYSEEQIMKQLKFWCDANIPLPELRDFQNALTMLSMTKMLTPLSTASGQRYRITYPAYIDFMSRLDQIGKVEIFKSLQDYHAEEKGRIK